MDNIGDVAVAKKATQVVRLVTSIALAALCHAQINRDSRLAEIYGAS